MANPLPAPLKQIMQASGGLAPVSLLDVLSLAGNAYYWSDASMLAPPALQPPGSTGVHPIVAGGNTGQAQQGGLVTYKPWILTPPSIHSYKSTQTATGQVTIQNLSGNTVQRDTAQIFNRQEMIGSLVYYRIWKVEAEYSLLSFLGSIDDAEIEVDGTTMKLSLRSWCNWSAIKAPYKQIGVSCPLTFGSVECGSTASTPCNNDYGSCSSRQRIQAIVLEWTGANLNYTQYAQPEPLRLVNNRIAG